MYMRDRGFVGSKKFILHNIMNGCVFYLLRVLIYATISFVLYNIVKDRFLSIDQFIQYKPGTKDR